jgi:hypothetical protein
VDPFSEVRVGASVGGLAGVLEGALAAASISIPVAKAAGLPSPTTSGPGEGSSGACDTIEVLDTGIGSLPLISLVAVERVTIVDIIGSWAFRSPFMWVTLLSEVAEWSIALLTSITKEGMAEGSTKDKGATPASGAEWSVALLTVVMLALLTKEGSTKDEGATPIGGAEWSVTLLTVAMLASSTKEGSTKDKGATPISGVEGGSMGTSSIGTTLAT